MANPYAIDDVPAALIQRLYPSLTLWNRVEGRPRTVNFERALRAEVRDALWMLTRQWQVGEFKGEDRGGPVFARLHVATTRLRRFRPGDAAAMDFDEAQPLDAQVERQPLPLTVGTDPIALDLRLLLGRRWLTSISAIADYRDQYIAQYPIRRPDPTDRDEARVCAHVDVWQSFAAVADRAMDGVALLHYLTALPDRHAYDGIAVLDVHKPAIDVAAETFVAWVERLFTLPNGAHNPAWQPSRLEYRFACSAPADDGEKIYVAQEYADGTLDWHSFELDADAERLGAGETPDPQSSMTRTMIPVPLAYAGMPHTRWWTMEDSRTNFGGIRPDTTDLAKLLFIEFGLVYSNDWFVVPFTLPCGSIAAVQGLVVTNAFGERTWVDAAGRGANDAWQRWSMYTVDVRRAEAAAAADAAFLLLPTVPKVQESAPVEEVRMIRDEIANMVWAIEKIIAGADGRPRAGAVAARELRAYHERLVAEGGIVPLAPPLANEAKIRYDVMSDVPEHWIPFIAVRARGSDRAIELQRASLPRVIEGDPLRPLARIQPRTILLRTGLDGPETTTYLVPEEEVPRAGVRITQAFQRTRWLDGRVFVWLGARKSVGRGEGSSGLAFDRIVPQSD